MSSKMYALVRWIGGEDDKTYTPGIPIEWIKGFNPDDFHSEEFDESISYVVEWRKSKKEPLGGWPVFDAYIIEISNRVSVLEKLLNAIDGVKSPTKVMAPERSKEVQDHQKIDDVKDTQENDYPEDPTDLVDDPANTNPDGIAQIETRKGIQNVNHNGKGKKAITQPSKSREPQDPGVPSTSGRGDNTLGRSTAKKRHPFGKQLPFDENASSESDDEEALSVLSGMKPLPRKLAKTKHCGDDSNGSANLGKTLVAIQRELKKIRKNNKSCNHRVDCYSSNSSDDEMIEIGSRGSKVFVTDDQWKAAKAARSYTAMGVTLLLAAFPMDVLLRSNLRGGSSKNKGKENADKKYEALDPTIIEAIYCSVRRRWKTFSKVGLGVAINNKLTYLRNEQKKKNTT